MVKSPQDSWIYTIHPVAIYDPPREPELQTDVIDTL